MIKWKNIPLEEKGIIVGKIPSIFKPEKQMEEVEIKGRDGSVHLDYKAYNDITLQLECHLDERRASIDDIISYLDGYDVLEVNGRLFKGVNKQAIEFSKAALTFRKFILIFKLNPISKEKEINEIEVANNTPFVISKSNYKVRPIFEIQGAGEIKVEVNEHVFYLRNLKGSIFIDSELKVAYNSKKENMLKFMDGDFVCLNPGENKINWIGDVASFKVKYQNTYIGG